jgi:hypothetical protein
MGVVPRSVRSRMVGVELMGEGTIPS